MTEPDFHAIELADMTDVNFNKVKGVRYDPIVQYEDEEVSVEPGSEDYYNIYFVMTNNHRQLCAKTNIEESAIHISYAMASLFKVDVLNKLEL